ncbi:isocitrate dehydrogenase [Thermosulfidibacter takaii ABI70S6]|uniref:Isocitrate dehydrogenase [NADP] n=1 Tax=Thermosulfidibacter takaii (strain DSM 17441 / JCM 13301 / NBRC 103674 / ABI70S6) TaxID=1298851 RepID=A0A0S3QUQ7_THET7|nr:NADP-dependent isocitrate dehydrogenase [Thermosulfidibacter takaii]BAT72044.1 isocitrate dehydrogenase [Thermosulfidibacter takaii ABI70S6]
MAQKDTIIWTKTDEAPYLASFSLLPIVKQFVKHADLKVEVKDISVAGRILAAFPDYLKEDQRVPDDLAELGRLVNEPGSNIIKLPNISATVPQLKDAIAELRRKGYMVPEYPEDPQTEEEKKIQARYAEVLGSAVNPVIRQGNNIRRVPEPVKESAKKYPDLMGLPLKPWPKDSKCHVSYMSKGDFYESEKSFTAPKDMKITIQFVDENGNVTNLKEVQLTAGEVFDGSFMNVRELQKFFEEQLEDAKKKDVLFSLHLKATMMKVSDPPIFGYCIKALLKDVYEKYGDLLEEIGFNPNNGLVDLEQKMQKLPEDKRKELEAAIKEAFEKGPKMYMVDSDKGITNLHAPNLVIIDASMPVVVRDGGKAWGPDGKQHDAKCVIPDRCYAPIYEEIIEDCKKNGAFDRRTMGTVINIGLMAMKAEEYGSHDKTFLAPASGTFRVVDEDGNVIMEHKVGSGDIWRGCQVKDIAVKDWVKLAVELGRSTGFSVVFWLDKNRAHHAELIKKVETYLKDHDTTGLDIRILSPAEAMKFTCEKVRKGENTIAVTGNVLRDYLTDLFPILEVGTSAKMLSVIPQLAGGKLFEAGAGGSAPKHVQQFLKEGHLRWDSIAEFVALAASLEFAAELNNNKRAALLAKTANEAIKNVLENQKWPGRKVRQLCTRGEHFYFAMYWAKALAEQDEDPELKAKFSEVYKKLSENEQKILEEIAGSEGKPVDIDGYYFPDEEKVEKAMRPSPTFNDIIDSI